MPFDNAGVTIKARLNLNIDQDLKDWAMQYAYERNTTVTTIICNFLRRLMDEESKDRNEDLVEQI